MMTVLSIDPGREKCGIAVVTESGVLRKEVIATSGMPSIVPSLISEFPIAIIIIGNGTGGRAMAESLRTIVLQIPIELVDETLSTMNARKKFFKENPPKGLRRLIPLGLLVPDRPYDDYVAVILAENYLNHINKPQNV